jgi:hypothetical protein
MLISDSFRFYVGEYQVTWNYLQKCSVFPNLVYVQILVSLGYIIVYDVYNSV